MENISESQEVTASLSDVPLQIVMPVSKKPILPLKTATVRRHTSTVRQALVEEKVVLSNSESMNPTTPVLPSLPQEFRNASQNQNGHDRSWACASSTISIEVDLHPEELPETTFKPGMSLSSFMASEKRLQQLRELHQQRILADRQRYRDELEAEKGQLASESKHEYVHVQEHEQPVYHQEKTTFDLGREKTTKNAGKFTDNGMLFQSEDDNNLNVEEEKQVMGER